MKNRYIPFGYEIRGGVITVHPAEAEAVRMIYALYASGKGYGAIAARMNEGGAAYHAGAGWNKHMVKRILENGKYLGSGSYPAIVGAGMAIMVTEQKSVNPYCKKPVRKECPTDPPSPTHATDRDAQACVPYNPLTAVHRMVNEINRAIEQNHDVPEVRVMILVCAAAKYEALGGTAHG